MVECRKFLTLKCMDRRVLVSLSGKEKKKLIKKTPVYIKTKWVQVIKCTEQRLQAEIHAYLLHIHYVIKEGGRDLH